MHHPMSTIPAAWTLALLAVGCAAHDHATRSVSATQPSPPPSPAATSAPDAPDAPDGSPRIDQAAAEAVVDGVMPAIASIRGLEFLHPVPVEVIDDARARDYMTRRVELEGRLDRFRATERAYRLLGLVPQDFDALEALMGAMEEQAGGFYDPETDRYFLMDDMPAAMTSVITAHEMVHALEDQHYDLEARIREVQDSDDRSFAAAAVHEGSAMLAMTVFATREMLAGRLDPAAMELGVPDDALRALPAVMVRQLTGVYVLGMHFMARGNLASALSGGYPVEDAARVYADGPTSSEQILHPELYWDPERRDDPIAVNLPDLAPVLGRGWRRVAEGDFGELALAVLVDPQATADPQAAAMAGPAVWTNPAATGWGGDAWQTWRRRDALGIALSTVWDREIDAKEFVEALEGRDGLVARRAADRVAVVAGFPDGAAQAVLEHMLK